MPSSPIRQPSTSSRTIQSTSHARTHAHTRTHARTRHARWWSISPIHYGLSRCIIGVGNIHASRQQWADAIATYKHAIEVEVSSHNTRRHSRTARALMALFLNYYFVLLTNCSYLCSRRRPWPICNWRRCTRARARSPGMPLAPPSSLAELYSEAKEHLRCWAHAHARASQTAMQSRLQRSA
jgi:hypothetical protein